MSGCGPERENVERARSWLMRAPVHNRSSLGRYGKHQLGLYSHKIYYGTWTCAPRSGMKEGRRSGAHRLASARLDIERQNELVRDGHALHSRLRHDHKG